MQPNIQCELKDYQINSKKDPQMVLRDLLLDEVEMCCFCCPLEPFCQPVINESLYDDTILVQTKTYDP